MKSAIPEFFVDTAAWQCSRTFPNIPNTPKEWAPLRDGPLGFAIASFTDGAIYRTSTLNKNEPGEAKEKEEEDEEKQARANAAEEDHMQQYPYK